MRLAVPVAVRMVRQAKVPSDKVAVAQQRSVAVQVDRVGTPRPWQVLQALSVSAGPVQLTRASVWALAGAEAGDYTVEAGEEVTASQVVPSGVAVAAAARAKHPPVPPARLAMSPAMAQWC